MMVANLKSKCHQDATQDQRLRVCYCQKRDVPPSFCTRCEQHNPVLTEQEQWRWPTGHVVRRNRLYVTHGSKMKEGGLTTESSNMMLLKSKSRVKFYSKSFIFLTN